MSENNEVPQFYIINDIDRPDEKHVAQILDNQIDRAEYLSHELRDWGELTVTDKSANIIDFGFDITFKNGIASFEKTGESVATYEDGSHRAWQGSTRFGLLMDITDATNVVEETEEPMTHEELRLLLMVMAERDLADGSDLEDHPCYIAATKMKESNDRANECNELIATLAIKNSKLVQTTEKCLQTNVFIQNLMTSIGGPLNDNKLGYTRDQLAIFRRIEELISEAVL